MLLIKASRSDGISWGSALALLWAAPGELWPWNEMNRPCVCTICISAAGHTGAAWVLMKRDKRASGSRTIRFSPELCEKPQCLAMPHKAFCADLRLSTKTRLPASCPHQRVKSLLVSVERRPQTNDIIYCNWYYEKLLNFMAIYATIILKLQRCLVMWLAFIEK